MCGLAGWIGPNDQREAILRMHEALRHRGPDGEGTWFANDGCAGLAHRRLAILSPGPSARQPMGTGGHQLVFNGEIYNHAELRADLEQSGARFEIPGSDTEVLLRACMAEGTSAIGKLHGMFAFALYDEAARSLLLARDPFGIKPLYYAEVCGGIVFASELRSILASELVSRQLDPAAVAAFFQTGSVPEPSTLIAGVRLLPAGCLATWTEAAGLRIRRYWQPEFPTTHSDDPVATAREALRESISRHLVSDVPVGIFLSGGIDSSVVAAAAAEHGPLTAYSLVFDDPRYSEETRIREVAGQFGLKLRELRLGPAQARMWFDDFLSALDQPSVDGFNTFCVSRWAASHGAKVVLSGLGGDEVFGGYPSFSSVPHWISRGSLLAKTGGAGRLAGALLDSAGVSPRARRVGAWMQSPASRSSSYALFRGVFSQGESQALLRHFGLPAGMPETDSLPAFSDPRDTVSYLELTRYMRNQLLRDSDVMSMANGLELRVPLVDSTFFDSIANIPPDVRFQPGKALLASAAPRIPDSVRRAPKQGFSLPLNEWWSADRWGRDSDFPAGVRPGTWARRMAVIAFRTWADRNGIDLPENNLSGPPSPACSLKRNGRHARLDTGHSMQDPPHTSATPPRSHPRGPVLLLAPTFGNEPGGIQEFTREIIRALDRIEGPRRSPGVSYNGTPPPDGTLLDWADAGNSSLRDFAFLCETLRACLNWRPRVILSTFPRFAPVGVLCARLFGIPFITAAHGIEVWDRLPFLKRHALQQADRILAVSRFTAKKMFLVNGISNDQMAIFPNTVDTSRFCPGPPSQDLRARLSIPDGSPILLTVARLEAAEQSKGVETIWDALGISSELNDAVHVVVGDGNDLDRLRDEAGRRGLANRVRFAGTAASVDLPEYYRTADAFVMTGVTEGFGIVFLEAMACGTPVVAASAGGTRDALLDGQIGWLVDPSVPAQTASAIAAALTSDPSREPRCDPDFLRRRVEASFGHPAFQQRLSDALDCVFP